MELSKPGRAGWLAPLLLLVLGAAGCRSEEGYPDRPILLVCPWAVGGGTDRLSRQIAAYLEPELGVPVNVINATGGAGVTGHSRGARARPDGYTITMMTVELNMLHWRDLTDISWTDFRPLMMLNQDPAAVFVRASDERWQDLAGALEEVRKNPGQFTASGTASGGIWHLALAGWLRDSGVSPSAIKWVPMQGAGPSLQELISGGIDFVCCSLPEARTLMLAGEVRALGVMADARLNQFPDVPTFREQGSDWALPAWRGLGVPRGTPDAVVERLSQALQRIMSGETLLSGKSILEFARNEGFNLMALGPEPFQEQLVRFDRELGALLTSPEFSSVRTSRFDAMAFPKIIIGLAALVLVLILAFERRSADEAVEATPGEVSRRGMLHFAEIVLAVAVYILLAEFFGFVLTAAMLVFLLFWRLGARLWVSGLVTLFLVPVVYELFGNVLRVPLPRGFLGW